MKLNLWCWNKPKKGYINLDIVPLKWVDIVHNLETYPYPFKDNELDNIFADNILEHISDLVKFMEESNRILVNKWTIDIIVPFYTSSWAFADPTHKRFFTYNSFDYFTKDFDYNFYTNVRFKILDRKIIFTKKLKLFEFIFNKIPNIYQSFFAYIIPASWIIFKLEKNND